jgi:orotidine-5'-phosphate decarboxylase
VAGAVRAAEKCGVDFLTVHAAGGKEMMKAAMEASGKITLLAVTVLTSLSEASQVLPRAREAVEAGVRGLVCSPHEIELLKKEFGGNILLVVPGIRPEGSDKGDQKRIMPPEEAARLGADYLVIGRPITQADDPAGMAQKIVLSLQKRAA